jgi:Ca2+-binding RTX toxin-like protein
MVTELEYALMAGRAYQSTRPEANLFPALSGYGWSEPLDKRQSDQETGFESGYFQRGNEIVISYAGTDPSDLSGDMAANIGLATGVGSAQLTQAAEYYLQVQAANPGATITFTGHSLGGGLAALMGVFFGKQAVTFDQAPIANSAELSLIPPNVAANLFSYLVAQVNQEGSRKYSDAALVGLADFLALRAGRPMGEIPNSSLVASINVQGELLSGVPYDIPDRIGGSNDIPTNAPGVSGVDLHSQALLTAFLQSMQTAPSKQALNDVTFKLTDLMGMIFSRNLYRFDTDTDNRNFLERLVQNETGNAMVTRFTKDLWKLAQEGGLTMADDTFAAVKLVSQTLIAFAMQKYYTESQGSAGYNRELFTELSAGSNGGIRFDLADVTSDLLSTTKGYSLYFHNYVANSFSPSDRDRTYEVLPGLRDWYVQAGRNGMEATDTQNRGAFMLGGLGADVLTGGTGVDLLVGNPGHDRLADRAGADTLMGGVGFDTYVYNTGDGNDRIEDADARGLIVVNGQRLLGGVKKADHTYWENADGTIRYEMSGTDLVVKLNGTQILTVNEDFQNGQFGIRLIDATEPNWDNGYEVVTQTGSPGTDTFAILGLINNVIHYGEGDDIDLGDRGNDQLFGEDGIDSLYGNTGDDRLYGGAGDDLLYGDSVSAPSAGFNIGTDAVWGRDLLDGGDGAAQLIGDWGDDLLVGGLGDDLLYGDSLTAAQDTASANDFLDGGEGEDELHGMAGDDVLWGGAGNDQFQGGDGVDELIGGGWGEHQRCCALRAG